MTASTIERPPRENLLRISASGVELRAAGEGEGESSEPVMAGYFAVFNQWTEIKSWEGNFLERFAPGAFKKTIRENREQMKCLFQHGYDYVVGDKPLGPIDELREEAEGVYYEVPLLDAGYVRDHVLPGLEKDLYGASFRFRVIREEFDEEPGVSDDNPQGLPERTVKEVQVPEFGPVTFPAYDGASAGIRSLRPSELALQVAFDRMESQDAERAHDLATWMAEPPSSEGTDDDSTSSSAEEKAQAAADREERDGDESNTAPLIASAEAEPHPDDGRREQPPFGGTETRTPPWRQQSKPTPPWQSKGAAK